MHSSYTDVPASLTDVLYSYVLKNNNKNIVDNVATIDHKYTRVMYQCQSLETIHCTYSEKTLAGEDTLPSL